VNFNGNYDPGFKLKATFKEDLIEDLLSKRKKISNPDRRNGLENRVNGDKTYRYVEQCPDFF